MKKQLKKGRISGKGKWLFSLLALCLMMMALPNTVWAQTEGGGLCPHHTEHTEDCGYAEGNTENSCTYVCEICQQGGADAQPDPEEITEEDPDGIPEKKPEGNSEEDPDKIPEEGSEEDLDKIPEENAETLAVGGSIAQVPYNTAKANDEDIVAYQDAVEYEIWVGDVQVTSENKDNVLADGDNAGTVSYDPVTNTLTLDGANIVCDSNGNGSLRSERDDLTVNLLGNNTIQDTSTSAGGSEYYYVFSAGDLTFCGDGRLEITGPSEIEKTTDAIRCKGNFELQDATVDVTVGDYSGSSSCENCAIYVSGTICINGGKLTAKSGTASDSSQSVAIYACDDIEILSNAKVTAESGKGMYSYVIFNQSNGLTIRNSTVSLTSGEAVYRPVSGGAGGDSIACLVDSNLKIYASEVTALSGEAESTSRAIDCGYLELNESSSVTVTGGTAETSFGLFAEEGIVLHDSMIAAEAGQAKIVSMGAACYADLELNGSSSMTATAGTTEVVTGYDFGAGSFGLLIMGKITLNDGVITAETDQGFYSWGTWCGQLEVNNGSMTIRGGNADKESYGLYVGAYGYDSDSSNVFTLKGGSVRAEAGSATDQSIGLYTDNAAEISGGKLVAIAGQASVSNAISSAPNFVNGYQVIVKAGNSEADAAVKESPTEATYLDNAYVSIKPYNHTHAWSDAWSSDDTHHWHACTEEDCGITDYAQMDSYGVHTYDDDDDVDCNICGATRTVSSEPNNPSYRIIDGADSKWVLGKEGSLTFTGNGDFAKFEGVKVDGSLLAAENYDVQSGSTIVMLKDTYLNTLAEDSHNFEILWTDGTAGTAFTVVADTSGDGGNDNETGGNGNDGDNNETGGNGTGGNNNETGGNGNGGNNNESGGNGSGGNNGESGGNGTGSNNVGADESSTAGGNSSRLSSNSNGSVNTDSVPADKVSVNNVPTAGGNKKDDVPKTGDDISGSWLWLWLVLAASVAGAGIFLTGKRQVIIRRLTTDRNEAKKQG